MYCMNIYDRFSDVKVCVIALSVVDLGFGHGMGIIKFVFAKHAALKSRSKD